SFHDQLLLLALSAILPGLVVRSSALAPRRWAIFWKRASRAAQTAFSAAGAVPGQVVLPPEPPERPIGLSPIRTVIFGTSSPSISAVTMARTVRSPVPRSWVELVTRTDPSLLIVTKTSC